MGRAEIAQEMEQAETNLLRFKIKVKDRNEKEEREAIELEEKLRNPKGAKAKKFMSSISILITGELATFILMLWNLCL